MMLARYFKFFALSTMILAVAGAHPVSASMPTSNEPEWGLEPVTFSSSIKVTQTTSATGEKVDLVHLGDGDTVEVRSGLNAEQLKLGGLTQAEGEQIAELKRDVLDATLRTTLSGKFNGFMVGGKTQGFSLQPRILGESVNPVVEYLSTGEDGKKVSKPKFKERVKGFVKFLNENMILSTFREMKHYKERFKEVGPKADEFGLSLNFKIEMQIGMGGFNIAKVGAVLIDVGYNKRLKQVVLRTGFRREHLSGGMALPSVKAEVRFYEMITDKERVAVQTGGHSWYPPAPPLLSLVLDSSSNYMAQGIVFSFNTGDIIPGGSLMNSVNEFEEKEKRTVLYTQPKPGVLKRLFARAQHLLIPPQSCQALF